MSGRSNEIVVRMYNVGFGDAFLVLFNTKGRQRRMLIDCGSIKAGPHSMDDVVARIIKDVTDKDGVPRIDIVVATHRHKDHVSGFANRAWESVEVGEVWMPWTEHPTNKDAKRIREKQAGMALHLSRALAPEGGLGADEWVYEKYQMAMNALSNESAMATLHTGFAGEPIRRFLPKSARDEGVLRTEVFPGAVFHIAGPSFSDEIIRDMDPPIGQSYLARFSDDGQPGVVDAPDPFSESWWENDGPLSEKDRRAIETAAADLSDAALTALESAVNGTSLFFIMQVGGANLVFPGDAQWGTWKAAMARPHIAAMLATTSFYKVGHHGSHNATPVDFVTKLGEDFFAMTSVTGIAKWPEIPRQPLLDKLGEKTKRMARSDAAEVPADFVLEENRFFIEARLVT